MSKPEKLLAKVTRGGLNKMAGAAGEKMSGGFVLGTRMGMRVEKLNIWGFGRLNLTCLKITIRLGFSLWI